MTDHARREAEGRLKQWRGARGQDLGREAWNERVILEAARQLSPATFGAIVMAAHPSKASRRRWWQR